MRAALPLLVLALAAAAIVAWLALGQDTAAPEFGQRSPRSQAGPSGVAKASGNSKVHDADRSQAVPTATTEPDTLALPTDSDGVWLDIHIVDAQTQQPVPNAEVSWANNVQFEHMAMLPPAERPNSRQKSDALLAKLAWHSTADATGIVRVALGTSTVQVTARSEGRYGSKWFSLEPNASEQGHVLAIDRDVTLLALVLDAKGNPASGVPVVLHRIAGTSTDRRGWLQPASTDHDGIATIKHAQQRPNWQADAAATTDVRARPSWRLQVATPGIRDVYADIDPGNVLDTPVTMQLPATGELQVEVLSSGVPLAGHLGVRLAAKLEPADTAKTNELRRWHAQLDAEGLATYPHLPLGQTFSFGPHSWTVDVAGPDRMGRSVRRTIELNQHLVTVAGRLVDENGKGLPDRRGLMHFDLERKRGERTERETGWVQVSTDSLGRFTSPIAPLAPDEQLQGRNLRLELTTASNNTQELPVADRELFLGHNELGDLALVVAPLICAGSLIYQHTAPTMAFVSIARLETKLDGSTSWQRPEGDHSIMTRDSAFELRGKVTPGRYRLHVAAVDHIPCEPLEFAIGATDLAVNVASGARFHVDCKLPDGLPAEALRVELVPEGSGLELETEHGIAKDRAMHTVRYNWKALRPGTYTLRIRPWGWQRTVYERTGIAIADGATQRTSETIDLTDLVACLSVQVQLPKRSGASRSAGTYAFVLPQSGELLQATRITDATSAIAIPATATTLMIGGEALILQERIPAQQSMLITPRLRPQTEIRVQGEQLPEGYLLFAHAEPLTPTDHEQRFFEHQWGTTNFAELQSHRAPDNEHAQIDANNRARLVMGDGPHRLRVTMVKTNGDGRHVELRSQPKTLPTHGNYVITLAAGELARGVRQLKATLNKATQNKATQKKATQKR